MQPGATTCTEDRIQHALERCLHGLSLSRRSTSWSGRSQGAGEAHLGPGGAAGAVVSTGSGMELAGSGSSPVCDSADLTWAGAQHSS